MGIVGCVVVLFSGVGLKSCTALLFISTDIPQRRSENASGLLCGSR